MNLRQLSSAKGLKGKRVLVRAGYDVPLDSGMVSDDTRIRQSLETIRYLQDAGARVILMAHAGRPGGKKAAGLSLRPVAARLSDFLRRDIHFLAECDGEKALLGSQVLHSGDVLMLENLRFCPGERAKDPKFFKILASLGDIYVNEAFSNSHRDHASMTGVPKLLPSYAGFHLAREVAAIEKFTKQRQRPMVAVIGGVKISSKLGAISSLLKRADHVLLGGALANTVLAAQGTAVGKSLVEKDMVSKLKDFPLTSFKVHIPVDVTVSKSLERPRGVRRVAVGKVARDEFIVDIGPDTVRLYREIISSAQTALFVGPMGLFEVRAFSAGTKKTLRAAAKVAGYCMSGGGDTEHAITKTRTSRNFDYVSSAGGALLALVEGRELPALGPLKKN